MKRRTLVTVAAIAISAVILGVIFSQAFLITQGFYVTHILEVLTEGIPK